MLIEPEISESSNAQALDEQGEQESVPAEHLQEAVSPLSEYEPATPEMVREQSRHQHFQLPELLNSEMMTLENQRFVAKSVDPEVLDVALLPVREISRISPETVASKTHRFEEHVQDVVTTAEQPYPRQEEQQTTLVVQEDLPAITTNSPSEILESAPQPSLSVAAAVQPRLSRPHEQAAATFNTRPHIPEAPTMQFSVMKKFPDVLPVESVTRVDSSDIQESIENTIATVRDALDPEFRSDYALVLPKSDSQELLFESQPLVKSVRPRPSLPPVPSSRADRRFDLSRPVTTIIGTTKSLPQTIDERVIKEIEPLESPPAETMTAENDIESPSTMQPLHQSAKILEQSSSPVSLSPQIRKARELKTRLDIPGIVIAHQDKAFAQEETHSPKMMPVFRALSSLRAPLFVISGTQEKHPGASDEENLLTTFSGTRPVTLVTSQEAPDYSYSAAAPFPRTQQVLNPQNMLVTAALVPLFSSKKMMTTLEDAFLAKKMAGDTWQRVPEAAYLLSERLSAGQPTQQSRPERSQGPPEWVARSANTLVNAQAQSLSFKPVQRTMVFGGRGAFDSFAKPVSWGMFARRERPVPDQLPPPKTVQADDVVTRITPQKSDEEPLNLAIEGPASRRQVISRPLRLPKVELDVEVTIRLKFWVLPDGTVGEVIPLQRGDVRLERAAIQYLKSWRFTPLPGGNQNVWGIIPITYTLR